MTQKLPVAHDRYVRIAYKMADMTGRILEENPDQWICQGRGQVFPKIESVLDGHFAGETVWVRLDPVEAFGDYEPSGIRIVPMSDLGMEDEPMLGTSITIRESEEDPSVLWYVTDCAEGHVVLDRNHPLAGIGLQFEIKVLDVKNADEVDEDVLLPPEPKVEIPDFVTVSDQPLDLSPLENMDPDELADLIGKLMKHKAGSSKRKKRAKKGKRSKRGK